MRFVGLTSALVLSLGLLGTGVARAEEMKEMAPEQMGKVAAGARYYYYWAPRGNYSASYNAGNGTASASASNGNTTYTATATVPSGGYGYGYNGRGAYAYWGGYYACWSCN